MAFQRSLHKSLSLLTEPNLRIWDFFKLKYAEGFKKEVRVHPRSLTHPITVGSKLESKMFASICLRESYHPGRTSWAPTTVLDAGANVGYAAVFFASLFPDCQVCAVEPEERNFKRLKANCAPYANIRCIQGALVGRECRMNVVNQGGRTDSFQVVDADGPEEAGQIEGFTVTSLMRLLEWNRIGLLKVDIEGSESDVFGNAEKEWLESVDMFAIEVHDSATNQSSKAVFQALAGIEEGYALRPRGENLFIERIGVHQLRR